MDQNNKNNNEIDLSKEFKDSETNEFKNESLSSNNLFLPNTPKIIQWVIKYSGGLIKDEKQAYYVLIGFITIAIIISLFLVFGYNSNQPTSDIIPLNQFVPEQ